ncbi:MAG TPA: hypothetical protein VFO85_15610 [Vicinamibacteria bacterium]|nr:hypothetical protein [Vicinamibacteria bacterium]
MSAAEARAAIRSVGAALTAPVAAETNVTGIIDSGRDCQAI